MEKLTYRQNQRNKEPDFGKAVLEVSIAILVVVGLFALGNIILGID